jgi:amino acid adenylation domain-containing protein
LLAELLRGNIKQQPVSARTIVPVEQNAQLSFAQERLWFLDQLMPDSPVFNVPLAVRLQGTINRHALERSVNEIVRRHDSLRTTFATLEGRPSLSCVSQLRIDLPLVDLSLEPECEREAMAQALISKEASAPFDLARGPLIRVLLVRMCEDSHVFMVTMHHIVSDGWSLVLFFKELAALYSAFQHNEASPLLPLPVQYGDYSTWQREWLSGDRLHKQLGYWKRQLQGELPVLDLPTDRVRPAVQTYNGAREWLELPEKLTESIMALGQRQGATLFMTLLAAFKVLLYRYTGQQDIIVGSPIANRPQTETETLIGFFLNNLALRTDLSGDPSFAEVLARVGRTALQAYEHQDLPFEKLIEELKPARDLSRTPVFQVYFNLFNFADEIPRPGSTQTISFVEAWSQSDQALSKFDLTLYAGLQEGKLRLAFVYNTDLFDAASIRAMLARFGTLLEIVVTNSQVPISNLSLPYETSGINRVLPQNAFIEFAKAEIEQSITDRFECQVESHPAQIAVKTRNHQWSYAELNRQADEVAQAILNVCGDAEERIALLFDHDAPMIAALLGALKAGRTYVPLDPSYPNERLAAIIADSQASALLTSNKNLSQARELLAGDLKLINLDQLELPVDPIATPAVAPDRLAYILYTSGSTGKPKGVMQNHRNVLHYIRVYTNNLHLSAFDRLTLLSSYCFDAAVMDIYGALLNGATLYPIDLKVEGLNGLAQRLMTEAITVYHSTPTVYRYFMQSLDPATDLSAVRLVVLGGEEVKRTDVELYQQTFSDECLFVNGLGPTEATVTLQNFIDKHTEISCESVPVGFPVDATEVLLLNDAGQPAEVCGEIAIKSEHVALGYWQNAEATAAAFSSERGAQRIYRTGDLGRRLADGRIKFEGRKDFQTKIRGFRVELGEVESALNQHELVRECAVVARPAAANEQRLIAYVVRHEPGTVNGELRDFLQQRLPEYMVPASFVVLESLPLTASGKINRQALPAPATVEIKNRPNLRARSDNAPRTHTEKLLLRIWSDLLGSPEIGIHESFFEVGGHSLLAVRLFALIEKRFGKSLPLATLFQAPTIAELAAILEPGRAKEQAKTWTSLVPITPIDPENAAKPPFFCVHALGGNVLEYYDLARHLGADQPFYGLQSAGLDGKHTAHLRVEDMAAHYINELRSVQPTGPYFIGGRSLGGMIAFEMARQLRAQGEEIGLLALLDTYPSGYAKLLRDQSTLRAQLGRAMARTKAHLTNLSGLSFADRGAYLAAKSRFAPRKLKSQLWRRIYGSFARLGRPLPRALQDIQELNSLAVRTYVPQVYEGHITLFWASTDLRTSVDLVGGWQALAGGGIDVHEIPGNHLDIIKEPHVGELAKKLEYCLACAQHPQTRSELAPAKYRSHASTPKMRKAS